MGRRVNGWRLLVEAPSKPVIVPEAVVPVPAPIPVHPLYEGEWAVRSTSDPTAYQMDGFTEAPARYSSRVSAEGQIFRRGEWEAIPYPDWWALRHPSGVLYTMTYRYYGDYGDARAAEGLSECVIVAHRPTTSSHYVWVRRPGLTEVWDCTLLGAEGDIPGWGHVQWYSDETAYYWRDEGEAPTIARNIAEARAAIEAIPINGVEVVDGVVLCVYCGEPAAGSLRRHDRCREVLVPPPVAEVPQDDVRGPFTVAEAQEFTLDWLRGRAGTGYAVFSDGTLDSTLARNYRLQRMDASVWLGVGLYLNPSLDRMRATVMLRVDDVGYQMLDYAIRDASFLIDASIDARELQRQLDAMDILPPGSPSV